MNKSLGSIVNAKLNQLFILPFGLVDKCIPRENLGMVEYGNPEVKLALYPGVICYSRYRLKG